MLEWKMGKKPKTDFERLGVKERWKDIIQQV